MIKAVLFDFDGTLVDFVASDIRALKELHKQFKLPVSCDEFINTSIEKIMDFHHLVEQKQIDETRMIEYRLYQTFKALDLKWKSEAVDQFRSAWYGASLPFPGVHSLLSVLSSETRLALVTNAYKGPEQPTRIKASGLLPYFEHVVIAGDIGCYKPDPGIFNHTVDLLGVKPEETLFVGDSLCHDIRGAKAVGMTTVWINSRKQSAEADFSISAVTELRDIWNHLKDERKKERCAQPAPAIIP